MIQRECFRICYQGGPRKSERTGTEWNISASGLCWWC